MRRFVEIDGRRYLWRDLLKLRREQKQLEPEKQLTLFELKTDRRPASQVICGRTLQRADVVQDRLSPSGLFCFLLKRWIIETPCSARFSTRLTMQRRSCGLLMFMNDLTRDSPSEVAIN